MTLANEPRELINKTKAGLLTLNSQVGNRPIRGNLFDKFYIVCVIFAAVGPFFGTRFMIVPHITQ